MKRPNRFGRKPFAGHCVAAAFSTVCAIGGYKLGALTKRGAIAAVFVGTSVLSAYGPRGGALLGIFFGSGSALSRLPNRGADPAGASQRNERQVLANGGVAAVAYLIDRTCSCSGLAMLAGSIAAATADTWATEIGTRSGQSPRMILSGQPTRSGLSGGVTPAGTLGSVAGAALIAVATGLLYKRRELALGTAAAGVAGAVVDSVLGELVQSKSQSRIDGRISEARGESFVHASGVRWIDNDVVNLACTVAGGLTGWVLWYFATER